MSVGNSVKEDMLWSAIWLGIALVAAVVVFFILSLLIADDPAAGLIFGAVAFVLVGGLMVRFGPGPAPNQEVWHDPDALPSMTHSTPEHVHVAPAHAAPAPAAPVARAPEPEPEPVAPVAPAAPLMAPISGPGVETTEVETPPPGTGISERVREAANAARLAAADLEAAPPAPVKPAALEAPESGTPDDLKKIKGVGPKLEELLHSLGIFHFSQVASWGAAEVAWMDSNLEGFFGRVTRDDWVGQAKALAGGGETEFSKRVDDGEVY